MVALCVMPACSSDAPATSTCSVPSAPSYAEHIGPLVAAKCRSCHSSSLSAAARQGAPSGVDFDDEARFAPFAALSLQRFVEATHAQPTLERCELVLLRSWVNRGPGSGDARPADARPGDARPGDAAGDAARDTLAPDLCPSGTRSCAGGCVDTQSDGQHCGGCDKPCGAGTVCRAGQCTADCGTLTKCGQSCADTQTSLQHCGGCDKPCTGGQSCVSGSCRCPTSQTLCQGGCVDTGASLQHCGGCNKPCTAGQTCSGGACGCAGSAASFSNDVQPIFNQYCATAGCHLGAVPKEGLDLTAARAYQGLVDVGAKQCSDGRKRVSTNGQASYLLEKLRGVNLCKGSQMPKQGFSLPKQQIDTIAAWICSGAPNN